jgi:hypothetical protein
MESCKTYANELVQLVKKPRNVSELPRINKIHSVGKVSALLEETERVSFLAVKA